MLLKGEGESADHIIGGAERSVSLARCLPGGERIVQALRWRHGIRADERVRSYRLSWVLPVGLRWRLIQASASL
jgi:hypothetical protein